MRTLSYTIMLVWLTIISYAQSPHGDEFKLDCALCHTSSSWTVDRQSMEFNHDSTQFELMGQHQFLNCRECHLKLTFRDVFVECSSCHTDMHNNTVGLECMRCHNTDAWKIDNVEELHRQGRFELIGAHKSAACEQCHSSASNLQYEPLGIGCIDCHAVNFQQTISPNHIELGFSENCLDCHDAEMRSWNTANIDHDFFPLLGGHNIGCAECHVSGAYTKLSNQCVDCHRENFTNSLLPNHTAAGIALECESCHTIDGWSPSTFNHITTGFELTGGHLNIQQCSDCHHGSLTNTSSECISCHTEQYNGAPGHLQQRYPTNCTMCHTTNNWLETSFDHSQTNFPLTGQHVTVDCSSCHTDGFTGTPTDCNSCHHENYLGTQTPQHRAAGIPTTCEECHSSTGWSPSLFNHITTGFELTGGHRNIDQCSTCHQGSLVNADPQCISCHQQQYDYAPDHRQFGYPTNCTMCHTTNNWLETSFDHSQTNFPLVGEHVSVDCASCHTDGFTGTPKDCNGCHRDNYLGAQSPNHAAAGIPTTCEGCHSPKGWTPTAFNHTTTGFELTGGHLSVEQCSSCHLGSVSATSSECISCHQVQYNGAPEHVQQGYPKTCLMCHTTNNWLETNFDHSKTNFPLTGAHISVDCSSCHANGFAGTSTQCYSCHQSDYNATNNPNHRTVNFPTDCQSCHSTSAWTPATFDHDAQFFPIYSGKHRGEWNACSDCHTNTSNYSVFSCLNCHEHNKSSMDSEHRNRSGYSYESNACYSCHPRGRADD